MFGVRRARRGSGVLGTATICRIALLLSALVLVAHETPTVKADEPLPGTAAGSGPRLSRKIKQTANPLAEQADDGPVPKGVGEVAPRRQRLTGPDPEIENVKEPLANVIIENNKTISSDEILKKIKTRPGRPPDPKTVKEDVRALHQTRWFFNVEARVATTKEGPVLVFKVLERPMLKDVTYKGNKKIKTKELTELTGLKKGGAFDVGANKESARRIESHYHEKGFVHAKVTLEKGESPDDREVVFNIEEGPKVHVDAIKFSGNKEISSGVLKTQVKTKTRLLHLFGGKFDPTTIPEDVSSLKQYYHSLGYFDVKITSKPAVSADRSSVTLVYEVDEGVRFKVNSIEFNGNQVIPEDKLRTESKLVAGQYFTERFMTADVDKMTAQYGELGRIFARVEPILRHRETPGIVDIVYQINEDRPYRVGRIRIHIEGDHPHTKESVILTRLRFRPGELASREKIKKSEQALRNSQVFAGAMPGSPGGPHIDVKYPEPAKNYDELSVVRGQNFGGPDSAPSSPNFEEPAFGAPPLSGSEPLPPFEEQPPGYLDYDVNVSETQTGRLMFGVGVNSNAGLVGNLTLEENNFDLFRPPTSVSDIMNGVAWRGGGQQFRIEATPGNQLSRYLISWRDPYFMEQNFSLGVSGFYFQRYFPNWTEQRTGGRLTVGRQFTPQLAGTLALRLEDVNISNPSVPTPPQLQQVLGSNFLSTIRGGIIHDTRDSSFLPGKGHYLELAYEQGISEFVYPRFEVDARQFFTLKERPDGGNRHIISTIGQFGWMDNGAPIFEKFYAGGFQSFRGFAFYGVTPQINGVRIGGRYQALGTVEYMLPVTADDTIQLVSFTDMGTVQDQISMDQFRMTVGAGVRLTIPAMGPMPIAIDFGVPIIQQSFDQKQLVAFYIGVQR